MLINFPPPIDHEVYDLPLGDLIAPLPSLTNRGFPYKPLAHAFRPRTSNLPTHLLPHPPILKS